MSKLTSHYPNWLWLCWSEGCSHACHRMLFWIAHLTNCCLELGQRGFLDWLLSVKPIHTSDCGAVHVSTCRMKNFETLHKRKQWIGSKTTHRNDWTWYHPNYVEIVKRGVSNRQESNLNPEQCLLFKFRNCQYKMSLVMRYSEKSTSLSMYCKCLISCKGPAFILFTEWVYFASHVF